MSVIVFVNFLSSVENKAEVDCFVNKTFCEFDNPFDSNKDSNEKQSLI